MLAGTIKTTKFSFHRLYSQLPDWRQLCTTIFSNWVLFLFLFFSFFNFPSTPISSSTQYHLVHFPESGACCLVTWFFASVIYSNSVCACSSCSYVLSLYWISLMGTVRAPYHALVTMLSAWFAFLPLLISCISVKSSLKHQSNKGLTHLTVFTVANLTLYIFE